MRSLVRCAAVGLAVVLLASAPATARAAPRGGGGGRPASFQLGLGPAVGIPGGGVFGRLPIDFQYHLRGGAVGPAIGMQAPLHFSAGSVGMNLGPMFLWDFSVGPAGAARLYLGPLAATGYGFTAATHGHGAAHFWFLTLGAQFKALWGGKVGLFVRPASFDLWVGNGWAGGNYTATAGLAVAF